MADAEPQQQQQQREKPPSRSFRSFIWDTDTHLKTAEERRLLRKLDWSILTIGCLGFFMKYLDQGNLANAYVSGMQEDLAMYGNEYTYAQTAYTCAYAVMQVPSTLIVQKIRPSVWLVFMEVGWVGFSPLFCFHFLEVDEASWWWNERAQYADLCCVNIGCVDFCAGRDAQRRRALRI